MPNPVSDLLNSSQLARRNGAYGNLGTTPAAGAGGPPVLWGLPPGQNAPDFSGVTKTFTAGGKPDYASQIENDSNFQALKNLLSAQGIRDAAHLRGAIAQAIIGFGQLPDSLPNDVLSNAGGLDPNTSTLAANNPFSTLARLAQHYNDQQMADKNQLAARGILSSGETGYQLGRLGQQNAQSEYDLTNSLLSNIDQLNQAYLQGQDQRTQQLAQGALTAENTAAQNAPTSGPSITATETFPGSGIFVDANGNAYDGNGNPMSLPTQTPPPSNTYTPPTTTGAGGIAAYDPNRLIGTGQAFGA